MLWYQTESKTLVLGPEPIGSTELGRTRTCCCSLVSMTTQHQPVRARSCSCTEIHIENEGSIHAMPTNSVATQQYQLASPGRSCDSGQCVFAISVHRKWSPVFSEASDSSTIVHWHRGCVTLYFGGSTLQYNNFFLTEYSSIVGFLVNGEVSDSL